jgi:hypothetical protein
MVRKLTELGPLDMPGKFVDWDREIGELASRVSVEGEEENKEPVAATQTEG